ncbi:adenine phosphoribosyltransferase [Williamsoniiplasma luminosum]|uniref:Adenine phosphoribosyltransferase n=1 Tax=Williamsoniiplasma luminosum TaxID=214888 RepID=A0A2K8NU81_9MOLU|nr:adenine phosphoribosyltransferase [Williamsoniiplasma luminosum]ATZ17359.1 adenine phosphoribosyltransferase [Williamsoniiplasma luminosum]
MIDIKKYILDVQHFPLPGIDFKDVTPILTNPEVFQQVVDQMSEFVLDCQADAIVAPEARGFIFASAVAYKTKKKLVLIRKPGKLPRPVFDVSYDLEYGSNHLQVHQDDLKNGDKVVIVDDILATGGTIKAIRELVKMQDAKIVGLSVVGDLTKLHPNINFDDIRFQALVEY